MVLLAAPPLKAQDGALSFVVDTIYTQSQLKKRLKKAQGSKDLLQLALVYRAYGDYYSDLYDNSKAFQHYIQSIEFWNALHDTTEIIRTKLHLAEFYTRVGKYSEAMESYRAALVYFRPRKEYARVAFILRGMAQVYRKQSNYSRELASLTEAINLNKIAKDTLLDIQLLLDQARSYQDLNQYNKAEDLADQALTIARFSGLRRGMVDALFFSGQLNYETDNFDKAIEQLQTAERFLDPDRPRYEVSSDIYRIIADCYYEQNNLEKAYDYLLRYNKVQQVITDADKLADFNRLLLRYTDEERNKELEAFRNQQRIAELTASQQQRLNVAFYAGFGILLLSVYFLIRFYQQKLDAGEIIAQQKEEINRQKITELENNLKIESLAAMLTGQEAERERVAKDLHDSLGGLLSTVKLQFDALGSRTEGLGTRPDFQKALRLLDSATQEVRDISRDMQPGSLLKLGLVPALRDLIARMDGQPGSPEISFQNYGLEERLPAKIEINAYRIVQELFNNTLKHAKAHEVLIQLTLHDGQLDILVEDDGVGFVPESVNKGMGTDNIASRVNFLKGELSIDTQPGRGTSTFVTIPVQG